LKYFLTFLIVLSFYSSPYAADNLVFYNAGKRDSAAWTVLREYFSSGKYIASFYQGHGVLEPHLEKIDRINAMGPGVFVGVEFTFGEEKHIMVAMAEFDKDGEGSSKREFEAPPRLVWRMEDISGRHEAESRRLAELIAAPFQTAVKRIPLFPLLGIDMPGVFVSIQCRHEDARSILAVLDGALRQYYRRNRL
jgi:hypothetical protein